MEFENSTNASDSPGIETHVREICHQLFLNTRMEPLSNQVARVLFRIAPDQILANTSGPEDIIRIFRARGLIPERLRAILRKTEPFDSDSEHGAAVGFAASVFPQRSLGMPDVVLTNRIQAYLGHRSHLRLSPREICASLYTDMPEKDAEQLLVDLGGLTTQDESALVVERKAGAAFYLATCHESLRHRIRAYWNEEANTVRTFRLCLPSPPSTFQKPGPSARSANWQRIQATLMQMLSGIGYVSDEVCTDLVGLEQYLTSEARKWVAPNMIPQVTQDFWEQCWERLVSGFPYFAFQASLKHWIRKCSLHHRWLPREIPYVEGKLMIATNIDGGEPGDFVRSRMKTPELPFGNESGLDEECLRWCREAYRLVRMTFYSRSPVIKAGERSDWAGANESHRKLIDELWHIMLAKAGETDFEKIPIKDLTTRHSVSESKLYTLGYRIRVRLWACMLARVHGRTNAQLMSTRRPSWCHQGGEFPFAQDRSSALAVATLARPHPLDRSLLWPFTARVFLHSAVVRAHPDPWTFQRYARELWVWLSDKDSAGGTSIFEPIGGYDVSADDTPESVRIREFGGELANMNEESEVRRRLERDLAQEKRAAKTMVARVARTSKWPAVLDTKGAQWGKLAGVHWVVPVWYLIAVEWMSREEALSRLLVDACEREDVGALADAIACIRDECKSENRTVYL